MTATKDMAQVRKRQIAAMGVTSEILGHILQNVSEKTGA